MKEKIEARIIELEKELESTKIWAENLSWRHNFQEKEIKYAKCNRLAYAIEELKLLLK